MGHSHLHTPKPQAKAAPVSGEERFREIRKVTLIGSAVDLSLGVAKIIGGIFASSQALVADGVHSLSDLATDIIVIYAAKHSHREADEDHPYGHGRIETLATVMLGVALIGVSIGIGLDAIDRLFHVERLLHPTMVALYIAIISVVSKEYIYHYSMHIAKPMKIIPMVTVESKPWPLSCWAWP